MGLQAYKFSFIIMLYLSLMASINLVNAKGNIYIVGDSHGWEDSFDFVNWSEGKVFHAGDVLVFKYEGGVHNVMEVDATAYDDCIKDSYVKMYSSGNDSVVLREGRTWFICGVNDHCENGQKLDITVTP